MEASTDEIQADRAVETQPSLFSCDSVAGHNDKSMDPRNLKVDVLAQPEETVCGPTCLHAIYAYFGLDIPLQDLIDDIQELPRGGGTLAVQLGCHAIANGFRATIYTNNLQTFDPTWFQGDVDLSQKLRAQRDAKKDPKLGFATDAYLEFLRLGGKIKLESISRDLLRSYIDRHIPLLAGLSATYLYNCPRELADGRYDDVGGAPSGHFVVLRGYGPDKDMLIADPLADNPGFSERYYSVPIDRLLAAIHLGIVTYDANVLALEPDAPELQGPQP